MTSVTAATKVRLPAILAVAGAVVLVDQGTKWWASTALAGHAPVAVLGDFLQLRLLYNPGAAFSIGSGLTWVFTVAAAAAVAVLLWVARKAHPAGQAVALGLLLGGATTHLLDRLFRAPGFARGHVVDFIDYNGWFVGNVADIALVVGAGLILVGSARR